MITQYGVLLNEKYESGWRVHMDDTMHPSLDEAKEEALALRKYETCNCQLIGIFSVDTETGEVETEMDTAELKEFFDNEDHVDEYDEDGFPLPAVAQDEERGEVFFRKSTWW